MTRENPVVMIDGYLYVRWDEARLTSSPDIKTIMEVLGRNYMGEGWTDTLLYGVPLHVYVDEGPATEDDCVPIQKMAADIITALNATATDSSSGEPVAALDDPSGSSDDSVQGGQR